MTAQEGFLWKRAALKFQKRWFFLQSAGTLCYYDPLNPGSNAIVCGQLSSVIVTNVAWHGQNGRLGGATPGRL